MWKLEGYESQLAFHLRHSCVLCLVIHSCLTLCDPMDYSQPGSSVWGFSRWEYWSGVVMPFFRGSSQPRDQTWISCFAFLALSKLQSPFPCILRVCLSSPTPFSLYAALCFFHTRDSQTGELNLIHSQEGLWKSRFLVPTGVPDPVGLGWNLSVCISNELPGDAAAGGLDHSLTTTVLY